jgi:hypothetical protein
MKFLRYGYTPAPLLSDPILIASGMAGFRAAWYAVSSYQFQQDRCTWARIQETRNGCRSAEAAFVAYSGMTFKVLSVRLSMQLIGPQGKGADGTELPASFREPLRFKPNEPEESKERR